MQSWADFYQLKYNLGPHITKAPGLDTDALLFYLIFTYEAIF